MAFQGCWWRCVPCPGVGRRPEQRGQRRAAPASQRRHENVIGAETNASRAGRARGLVERLHVGGNVALQNAEILDQLERDAARNAGDVSAFEDRTAGQQLLDMGIDEASAAPPPCRAPRRSAVRRRGGAGAARSASSPETSLADGAPIQRSVPSEPSANVVGAGDKRSARASNSPASAFCAAACSALRLRPPADGSGAKRKPANGRHDGPRR